MKRKYMGIKKNKTFIDKMFLTAFTTYSFIEFSTVGANLFDAIIVTKYMGAEGIAALGLTYPFFSFAGIISGIFSTGMQISCTTSLARGETLKTRKTFSMMVFISLVMSILFSGTVFLFVQPISSLLGARNSAGLLLMDSMNYLKGVSFGGIPIIMIVVLSVVSQIDSDDRLAQWGAAANSIVNISLDLLAVRLNMGMFGIGLATSIAAYVNMGVLLLHFLKKDRMLYFTFKKLPWKELGSICLLGSDKVTRRIANIIRPVILNSIIISAGGSLGMAAMSIRNNFGNFVEIPITGIASAVGMLTGIAYGSNNKEECSKIAKTAHKYIHVYSLIMAVILFIAARPLAQFYCCDDPALKGMVEFSIYCLIVDNLFNSYIFSRISYLQSIHQISKTQILTICNKFVFIVFSAVICVNLWGSYGVIAAFPMSDILLCAAIFLYNVVIHKTLYLKEKMLSLPDYFYIRPQDYIELTIRDYKEVSLTSEQIQLFCKGHRIDPKKGFRAALCLDELARNIIDHGFPKVKDPLPIQVRMVIQEGDIILTIQDECPYFDLCKMVQLISDRRDPVSNIGIKIVSKMAKDIKSFEIMNINTVIITI